MSSNDAVVVAVKAGLQAKADGKPRKSPYSSFDQHLDKAWLNAWDIGTVREYSIKLVDKPPRD